MKFACRKMSVKHLWRDVFALVKESKQQKSAGEDSSVVVLPDWHSNLAFRC